MYETASCANVVPRVTGFADFTAIRVVDFPGVFCVDFVASANAFVKREALRVGGPLGFGRDLKVIQSISQYIRLLY